MSRRPAVGKVVKYSFCGFEFGLDGFKQVREPWRFRFYEVRTFRRPERNGVFNYYEGSSLRGKHSVSRLG